MAIQRIKNIIKSFVPPIVVSTLRRPEPAASLLPEVWSGEYASWEEAQGQSTGYNSAVILETCKNALLKIKNGEAVYERDSFLFNEKQYSWGLLAGLQRAALKQHGDLCVLDFGGSLGSSYYQNTEFLEPIKNLQWCVVEQQHFVACGKENFEDNRLKFYKSIDECLTIHKPDVLLLSSVLQYLEKPYEWIDKFVALNIPTVIIDRTAFVEQERDILTIQNVPESIYKASYPSWFFNKTKFQNAFSKSYRTLADFDSGFTASAVINGNVRVYWSGTILEK